MRATNDKTLNVSYFQRKPRPGFNFSFEQIFDNIRLELSNKINYEVIICKAYNDGFISKFINIIYAALHQSKYINHITGEVHFLNFFMRKKTVLLTIHDCRFMERKKGFPKLFTKYLYLKWPVLKSARIVSVSENTKKEIIKYTGCKPEKIFVIPVVVNNIFQPSPKEFNTVKPVILQIGTAPNKNIQRLTEAISSISCTLIIVGKLSEEQQQNLKNHNIDYINFFNLTGDEIYEQYKACDIVAFISTFEGFGMPIAEANCVERVVLTSDISSMPEVAAGAACLVDPFNIESIKQGLIKIINDDNYRNTLILNGRKNKLRFSVSTVANAYYDLYKQIAEAS